MASAPGGSAGDAPIDPHPTGRLSILVLRLGFNAQCHLQLLGKDTNTLTRNSPSRPTLATSEFRSILLYCTMSTTKDEMSATVDHAELQAHSDQAVDHLETKEKPDPLETDPGIQIDAATNKRLFWKISRRILVIQVITYFCQSLDKGVLNYASIMGIKDDANLKGQEVRPVTLKDLSQS